MARNAAAREARPEHADGSVPPGSWLILEDEQGVGESMRERLTSTGQRCILVRPGPSFVRQGDDQFALDPANRADFERLLEEARITAAEAASRSAAPMEPGFSGFRHDDQ